MNTYQFVCRSAPDGLKEWCSIRDENGTEVRRIDRDVRMETVREFHERISAQLEAEGCVLAPHQYTL